MVNVKIRWLANRDKIIVVKSVTALQTGNNNEIHHLRIIEQPLKTPHGTQ
jgi:hypothetical protein